MPPIDTSFLRADYAESRELLTRLLEPDPGQLRNHQTEYVMKLRLVAQDAQTLSFYQRHNVPFVDAPVQELHDEYEPMSRKDDAIDRIANQKVRKRDYWAGRLVVMEASETAIALIASPALSFLLQNTPGLDPRETRISAGCMAFGQLLAICMANIQIAKFEPILQEYMQDWKGDVNLKERIKSIMAHPSLNFFYMNSGTFERAALIEIMLCLPNLRLLNDEQYLKGDLEAKANLAYIPPETVAMLPYGLQELMNLDHGQRKNFFLSVFDHVAELSTRRLQQLTQKDLDSLVDKEVRVRKAGIGTFTDAMFPSYDLIDALEREKQQRGKKWHWQGSREPPYTGHHFS